MLKHPLLPIGLAFAGGICLGEFAPAPFWLLLVGAVLAAAMAALKPETLRSLPLWLAILLAGGTLHTLRIGCINPQDLRNLTGEITEEVSLTGVLAQNPDVKQFQDGDEVTYHSSVVLEVESLCLTRGNWQPAAGQVLLSCRDRLPAEYHTGRRVQVAGILQPPPGPLAPGLFDYRAFLRQRGIFHQLRVASAAETRLLDKDRGLPWSNRFITWAQAALAKGLPEQDDTLRLTWAMLLGWRPGLTDEVSATFMRSGTMHIFAISGLHIAMLAGVLLTLFRGFGLRRGICGLIALPLIWGYTAATGWQASAVRAAIMSSVVIAGWSLRRPSYLLNSLFAAGLIILVWDSRQLFQTSFQLSFLVVLCIALLLPLLHEIRPGAAKQEWIPRDHLPHWRIWEGKAGRYLYDSAAISMAAWVGSLPLIACYFNMFTPVSLLANLLIVPISGLALMAGMGSLLTAAWLPGIAELFNHAGWFFMRAMIEASDWFTTLPGAYHFVPPPPPWFFLIYYGGLVAIAIPALARKIRLLLAGLLALLVGGWLAASPYSTINRLTVLPFEDGHAVFFQGRSPDRHLLIDSGRIGPSERVVAPFLHAQGISRLPRLGLTHGDLGQIGGAEFVRTNFNAGNIITGPLPFRSPAYRALIAQYQRVPGLLQTVQAGDSLDGWQVLHPAVGETYSQADDGLLVLRGEFSGTRCLLLSDLGRPGQNRLMAKNPPETLRAEIVMVGKPTEGDPLADALLLAIQPKLIIVADAMYPAQARASRSLQQRLARYRIPVVYTRLSGAVTIEFRSEGWRAHTMSGEQIEGRDLKRLTAPAVASTEDEEQ